MIKEYYHDIDMNANQLFNSRLHNISTAARIILGATLSTADKGYMVYDTDLSSPYFWDGTQWLAAGGGGTGTLVALPFTTDHLATTNNQYVVGDLVWYLGNVYRCIANNNSLLPTSALYWTLLGAGFPLVQQPANWNSTSGNNQILNKPTIPAAQIQSDWTQSNNAALDFIKNKPTIPAAQVNSDWNATTGLAEILNKPVIPTVGTWGALNYPTWVSGTPFVKMTAVGTFALDTTSYQPLLTNPVTGTGTATRVAFWNTGSSISSDADLYWDNVNKRLGIGTATPGYKLDVIGTFHTTGQNTLGNLAFTGSTNKVVTATSAGLLVNDDIVTNFVKYNDILTQPTFAGRTVSVSPVAMNAGLFSTSFFATTQAQWSITDTSLGGVLNAKTRRYRWKNAYNLVATFTGSTSGNVLTTTGNPPLTQNMWIRLDDGTENGLGYITGGSGNSWTLNTTSTQGSQTMKAYFGSLNVYSAGFLYFGFWNAGYPGSVTATFKAQDATTGSIVTSGSTITGTNISVNTVTSFSYWKVQIPVANYLTDIEITFLDDGVHYINYQTQEMVVNYAEGIDIIPFVNKDGGRMFGTLSFVDNPDGRLVSTKGSITNAGALTMATGKFTGLLTTSTGVDMVTVDSNGLLGKQVIPSGGSGTVTSVGLTMPSAFSVANSPIINNGTIAVTGAGTVSQYVRGDGTLANFPNSTGGGSSVNYYLNGSISQGTFGGDTYYQLSKTPVLGAGTNFTRTNGAGNGYIASFITDVADPSQLNIPGGNWNVEFYFQSSASGGSPSFYAELYKVSATNVFTLIASDALNPEGITNGTTLDQYFTSIPVPQTTLLITDRLAIRVFVNTGGRTITLHTENGNLCEVLTTFTTGLTALNGLTDQVQNFADDTNVTMVSSGSTHTITWAGTLADNRIASASTWNSKQNSRSVNVVSVDTTAGNTAGTDYVYLVSGTTTITLPTAVGNTNRYTIKNSGTGVISIATTSSQTIDGSALPININVRYVSLDLMSDGANWNII